MIGLAVLTTVLRSSPLVFVDTCCLFEAGVARVSILCIVVIVVVDDDVTGVCFLVINVCDVDTFEIMFGVPVVFKGGGVNFDGFVGKINTVFVNNDLDLAVEEVSTYRVLRTEDKEKRLAKETVNELFIVYINTVTINNLEIDLDENTYIHYFE
mgnify:CR=1 FL=1